MMKNPPHPGEILREDVIEELGFSVTEVAERLGMSRANKAASSTLGSLSAPRFIILFK